MPKYRFTTDDGRRFDVSPDRVDLPNDEAAAREAQRALAGMATDRLPNGAHLDMSVSVQNEAGEVIYQASLEFNGTTGAEMCSKAAQTDGASISGSHRPRKDTRYGRRAVSPV